MSQPMKGLVQFIADLRNCRAHEAETKRVNSELANIRQKFRDPNLNGYNKKKYICKLIYIYLLGYDVDIGHVESVSLISSNKYSEKQVGYLAISLMLNENDKLLDMVINSAKKDLDSLDELNTCLALNCIATVGGRNIGDALSSDVFKLLISPTSPTFVRKKAALTLLRLYRRNSNILLPSWPDRIVALLDDPDIGVTTSVVSLVIALVQDDPQAFKMSYSKVVRRLSLIVESDRQLPADYIYYNVPAPWLFVKLFKLLQYYPPSDDDAVQEAIRKVIFKVVEMNSKPATNIQENNAQNAVLFEVINLAVHLEIDAVLLTSLVDALGNFLSSPETNIRYLALNSMAVLSLRYDSVPIKKYLPKVLKFLRDSDISVRRKAINLLYCLCDGTNVHQVVGELLKYLQAADHGIREEMVLRIAILTEKFATEFQWYVDTSLRLISVAGTHVSDEVWQRVVQIVVNNDNLQVYAARTVFNYLKNPSCNETMIKVGGYILGEYGHLIADDSGNSPIEQFLALHDKFPNCSSFTKGLLLTSYVKFVNLFVEIKPQLVQVFEFHSTSIESELQQRACEYLRMINSPNSAALLPTVWDEMPPFAERSSALLSRLNIKHAKSEDKPSWILPDVKERSNSTGAAVALGEKRPSLSAANSTNGTNGHVNGSNSASKTNGDTNGHSAAPPPPMPRKLSAGNTLQQALQQPESLLSSSWEVGYRNLLTRAEGVFYEDSLLQIGLKSEYRKHLGCVILYFKNTSDTTLTSLSAELSNPSGKSNLGLATKNFPDSTLAPGKITQQVILLDAKQPFEEAPLIKITYMAGTLKVLNLKLPIVLEKFMEPTVLSAEEYFNRWGQIGVGNRESQSIFKNVSASSDVAEVPDDSVLLKGLQWSVLSGVDKNPANLVGASILHTSVSGNFGNLLRLEPDKDQLRYRVTVRATDENVSRILTQNLSAAYSL